MLFTLPSLPAATRAALVIAAALALLAGCAAQQEPEATSTLHSDTPEQADTRAAMTHLNTRTANERADGWQLLFDGTPESLRQHWRGFGREDVPGGWQVHDSTLTFDPGAEEGGDLITQQQYDDFELKLDWKISEGGNSGIMYNVSEDYDTPWQTGPEMQVLDNERHPDAKKGANRRAGANYDLHAPDPESAVKPAGQWNEVRIVLRGDSVEHWLNGQQVVAYQFGSDDWKKRLAASKFADMPGYAQNDRGHIALQDHGDRVWYRNIKIRPMDAAGSEGAERSE